MFISKSGGLDSGRLHRLKAAIEQDVAARRYHGGVIMVARHGEVGLHEAIGHCYAGQKRPMTKDAVFSIFSVTKAFTNVLVFRAIERGDLALTTLVASIIPEFAGGIREKLTIHHLITHSTGLPPVFMPRPGMYIDRLEEVIRAICENVHATEEAGLRVNYSPMVAQALLGEMVRRVDSAGRSYRRIATEDLFEPLGMKDTSIGVRADLRDRKVVPDFLDTRAPMQHLGHSNMGENGAFEEEEAEMPWVGAVSTATDMHRFTEMLRRGGELDGVRIIGPAILERATRCQTGDKPNELYRMLHEMRGWDVCPAYIGLGFSLRGEQICHHQFGTLTSPRTFGNFGAGSMLIWVDPELDMTFTCLTAGVMNEADNIERFQRLSDLAVAAAT